MDKCSAVETARIPKGLLEPLTDEEREEIKIALLQISKNNNKI